MQASSLPDTRGWDLHHAASYAKKRTVRLMAHPNRCELGHGGSYLQPDPSFYYLDAVTEDGAPLLCNHADCKRRHGE